MAGAGAELSAEALTLARSCVAEVGLEGRTDECALMWSVLAAKATTEQSTADVARRYNSLFRAGARHPRAWVLSLNADGEQPAGWPQKLDWGNWRARWLEKLMAARAFVESPPAHPCRAATQYGGRCDDDVHACDATPRHWVREWCGKPSGYYAQAYWSVGDRTVDAAVASGASP